MGPHGVCVEERPALGTSMCTSFSYFNKDVADEVAWPGGRRRSPLWLICMGSSSTPSLCPQPCTIWSCGGAVPRRPPSSRGSSPSLPPVTTHADRCPERVLESSRGPPRRPWCAALVVSARSFPEQKLIVGKCRALRTKGSRLTACLSQADCMCALKRDRAVVFCPIYSGTSGQPPPEATELLPAMPGV